MIGWKEWQSASFAEKHWHMGTATQLFSVAVKEKGKSETFPLVRRQKPCNRCSNEPPEYTFQCFESRPSNTTSGSKSDINRR